MHAGEHANPVLRTGDRLPCRQLTTVLATDGYHSAQPHSIPMFLIAPDYKRVPVSVGQKLSFYCGLVLNSHKILPYVPGAVV